MISANKKKVALGIACGTVLAVSTPVVEAGGCGWSSCGSLVPRHRNYHYNRRPTSSLMGDIFSMPIYFNSLHRQSEAQRSRMEERSAPRYEMHEGPDGGVELTLEVPGVAAKDLSVELEDGNVLRIRGSRHHHQRGSTVESKFDQMFRMGDNVDIDNMSVTLSSGVLRISAPKKEKVVRKIPVESLDMEEVVEAKAAVEEKPKDSDTVEAKLVKDLNHSQAKSQESVDGLTMTEEDM